MSDRRDFLKTVGLFLVAAGCNPEKLFGVREQQPVSREFFGHMVQGDWIQDNGSLYPTTPVTTFIGTLRTWDSRAVWSKLWNGSGYDWTGTDATIAYAESIGAQVLFVFGAPPIELCVSGSRTVPTSQAWSDFVSAVARRYKGRIHAYEMWNEPALKEHWDGTPQALSAQTEIGASIIRSIDPQALIVSPSFIIEPGEQTFTTAYLEAGDSSDVIAFHGYAEHPDEILGYVATLRKVLGAVSKPIWNTEYSVLPRDPYMAQSLVIQAAAGIERVVWNAEIPGAEDYTDDTTKRVADWLVGRTVGPLRCEGDTRRVALSDGAELSWTDTTAPIRRAA